MIHTHPESDFRITLTAQDSHGAWREWMTVGVTKPNTAPSAADQYPLEAFPPAVPHSTLKGHRSFYFPFRLTVWDGSLLPSPDFNWDSQSSQPTPSFSPKLKSFYKHDCFFSATCWLGQWGVCVCAAGWGGGLREGRGCAHTWNVFTVFLIST